MDTERLTLALVDIKDAEFMIKLLNTEGWLTFIGNRNVYTTDDAIAYISKIKQTEDLFYWVVRIKDTNTPIGIISFLKRSYLDHFDIGFAFLPGQSGKGYAYEASKKVLSVVTQDPKHATILATTIHANTKSISLLKKLGLHFSKEMKVGDQTLHVYSKEQNSY